ncbi:hypothetical protein NDU88_007802 [Pleurodeles waltl]|uniref:Uncharacterized protein n=1 Tax=Pleurodeles waltl TaxID=8319 RepID=A0AAV7U1H4_PLEWA|nr:hypothetical protein NDU88_007802 [Pleurodeles waltl]
MRPPRTGAPQAALEALGPGSETWTPRKQRNGAAGFEEPPGDTSPVILVRGGWEEAEKEVSRKREKAPSFEPNKVRPSGTIALPAADSRRRG